MMCLVGAPTFPSALSNILAAPEEIKEHSCVGRILRKAALKYRSNIIKFLKI